jgi:hypothetical protein
MTETSRDPEVTDTENTDNGRTTLNLTCPTTKSKPLPERGTWSTKLDFILSVVMDYHVAKSYSTYTAQKDCSNITAMVKCLPLEMLQCNIATILHYNIIF